MCLIFLPPRNQRFIIQLGEMTRDLGKSKLRARKYWKNAMNEDPKGHWGLLAADRLGFSYEDSIE